MAIGTTDSEARIGKASPGLRFFLFASIAVALMVLDHRGDYLETVRRWLGAGMYPLQTVIDAPSRASHWVRENLALRSTLIRENAELRRQLLVSSGDLQRLAALKAENNRLRALLGAQPRVPYRVEIVEVMAVDMDPQRHRVVLDRGSRDGVQEGQALLDDRGVVGQVSRDQIVTSEAVLITDPDHAIPVEVVRNGLRTIAVGTGDLERLTLPYLTRNADVREGDLLVSSGLGGAFPAGYPVAVISKVDGASNDAFLEVSARPTAALDRLHEILLVSREPAPAAAPVAAPVATEPAAEVAK